MPDSSIAILVHGGAGRFKEHDRAPARAGCERAAQAGWEILARGGSALDAVEAAVVVLEDDPMFNAGTGAVMNAAGEIELDASIMEGETLRAGAVAAVRRIKNPIRLSRRILDDGRHVLLAADGALRFAKSVGIAECPEEALVVERQRRRWQDRHGTVGAVAVDARGVSAAATSTGGIFDKLPGRVGDSALIGSGTYADKAGAASCTGSGEAIIRVALARHATGLLEAGLPAQAAAQASIALLASRTGRDAGLIVVDRAGRIGFARNTLAMPVCRINANGMATAI